MKQTTIVLLACLALAEPARLYAQETKRNHRHHRHKLVSSRPPRSMPAPSCSRSTSPVANFTVQNPVPTYFGSNQYTIDSDYGVFTADGNAMLMRRVAEIQGIAALQAMSQTSEFTQAAAQAAETPLNVAQDLITNPVSTIASVPRGILGFLNQAGQAVKNVAEGNQPSPGNVVENLSGFAQTKRDLAIKLGVDPYCNNEVFQQELNKVAWPAFLGKFAVNLGMGAISGGAGAALSGLNWTATTAGFLARQEPGGTALDELRPAHQ